MPIVSNLTTIDSAPQRTEEERKEIAVALTIHSEPAERRSGAARRFFPARNRLYWIPPKYDSESVLFECGVCLNGSV